MGAPKGNQFWMLRSKHGRDKLFKTPELMWEAACEYFQWCVDNPWYKVEQLKSTLKPYVDDLTGETIISDNLARIPIERPYTYQGLCQYLGCNTKYFTEFASKLAKDEKDFTEVITRIADVIYQQKFEGASVGAFNANIIARDLGLSDKKDFQIGGKIETDFSKLSTEELLKRAEAIRKITDE